MRRVLVCLTGLILIASCGRVRPGSSTATPRTVVEVDNRGFYDMTVYVINGGERVRIGQAIGNSKTELTIPASLIAGTRQLQFLADPIGSNRRSVSEQIHVDPGDRVTLIIPP